MKNFTVFWGSRKNPRFRGGGGFTKNQYIGGIALKRGIGQFADLRGLGKKEGGGVFKEG